MDQRIVLQNSNFARLHSLGTSWSKIRVGMRFSMTNTGADLTGTPLFAMGLCAGTTNIYLDATTDHFVGHGGNATTWGYTVAGSGNMTRYTPGTGFIYAFKKVGTALTFSGVALAAPIFPADATAATRRLHFVDITKGSPNFTIGGFVCTNMTASPDVLDTDFLAQIVLPTPSFANHTYYTGQTIAVNEVANGYLTHASIAWNRSSPTFEICDFAVVQLA